jgi:hypothetical protein
MSGFVVTPSFWQQSQSWRAAQSASTGADSTTVDRMFGKKATSAEDSLLGPIGSTIANASSAADLLAAQRASDRVNAKVASLKSNAPKTSDANVSTEVTYTGSLASLVDFGSAGPSPVGGFKLLGGADLQKQFKAAMGALKSNGDPIDTVTLSGTSLIASTSGLNAHPVFTLTLKPDSGIFTFVLRNPIDMKASRLDKITSLDLSGLVQAVNSDGTAVPLTNGILIQVHNGKGHAAPTKIQQHDLLGNVTGLANGGAIFQGGLAYTGPNNTPPAAKSKTPTKYTPPTNPLTGKGYAATAEAAAATFGSINIFA